MNIDFELRLLESSRTRILKIMKELPEAKLLTIPAGFNSNPLWQIGHCVASQQRLMYMRSGLPMHISEWYGENFKNGSSPKSWNATPDIKEIKNSILETVSQLREDLEKGVFKHYESFTTAMGFTVNNHLEALSYANFHEAEHTGNLKYLIQLIG